MERVLTIEDALKLNDSKSRERDIRSCLEKLRLEAKSIEERINKQSELLLKEKKYQCELEGHINLSEERQDFDCDSGMPYGSTYRVCGRCGAILHNEDKKVPVLCKK
jgi:hypothetical protein